MKTVHRTGHQVAMSASLIWLQAWWIHTGPLSVWLGILSIDLSINIDHFDISLIYAHCSWNCNII